MMMPDCECRREQVPGAIGGVRSRPLAVAADESAACAFPLRPRSLPDRGCIHPISTTAFSPESSYILSTKENRRVQQAMMKGGKGEVLSARTSSQS